MGSNIFLTMVKHSFKTTATKTSMFWNLSSFNLENLTWDRGLHIGFSNVGWSPIEPHKLGGGFKHFLFSPLFGVIFFKGVETTN